MGNQYYHISNLLQGINITIFLGCGNIIILPYFYPMGTMVRVVILWLEARDSSHENSRLQKCKVRLRTIDPSGSTLL